MDRWDVAIVGAGIAGLSLAWHLNRAGKTVIVLEQSAQAEGASVRNFGMIWVVGQPAGELHDLALRSRELWEDAADDLGFWIRRTGSLTLAYEELEVQVLNEFLEQTQGAQGRILLSSEEILTRFPNIQSKGLKGGMLSESEGAVDPREVVHAAAECLAVKGVEIRFDTTIAKVEDGRLLTTSGEEIHAEKIVVCPGPKLFEVLPNECREADLTPTRLQMMRMRPISNEIDPIGIHLCAGLTLGHYANFRRCESLPKLLLLHEMKWPKQVECGIHVLVAEHPDGTITVGDSHQYGRGLIPYRDDETDEAILEAMDEFLPRSNYEVIQRWEGTYNTHNTLPYWWKQVRSSVWALNLFGTGMTLSFGFTERLAQEIISHGKL